ncbi:MAG TPA: hypothetical protein VF881_09220 [Polyangiaceae bacterium]
MTVACLAAIVACGDLDDSPDLTGTAGSGVDAAGTHGGSPGAGGSGGTKATGGSAGTSGGKGGAAGFGGSSGSSGASGSAGDMGGAGGTEIPDTGPPPPTQHHVGGGCTNDMECVAGLMCDRSFPRGMCTKSCTVTKDCGSTGVCFANTCFHVCPCTRNGYICIGEPDPDPGETGADAADAQGGLADKPFCGLPAYLDGGVPPSRDGGAPDVSADGAPNDAPVLPDVAPPEDASSGVDVDNGG